MKYSIKLLAIFISVFASSNLLIAQTDFQKRFEAANTLLEQKQYEVAKDIWKELAKENPNNANVNYKTGLCLLNTTFEKTEALKYLNLAKENNKISIENKYESLLHLKKQIDSIQNCNLKRGSKSPVMGDGDKNNQIMIIGETPGEEEEKSGEGGIEAIAADLDGTEKDLMGNLMNALKIAKGMDNEKLEVQIGNTLKFFVSTYIDKEENER